MSTEVAHFAVRPSMIGAAANSTSRQLEFLMIPYVQYDNGTWSLLDDTSEDCRTCPTHAHQIGLWPAIESRPNSQHDRLGRGPTGTTLVEPSPSTRHGRKRRPSLPPEGPTRATSCPGSEQNASHEQCMLDAKRRLPGIHPHFLSARTPAHLLDDVDSHQSALLDVCSRNGRLLLLASPFAQTAADEPAAAIAAYYSVRCADGCNHNGCGQTAFLLIDVDNHWRECDHCTRKIGPNARKHGKRGRASVAL